MATRETSSSVPGPRPGTGRGGGAKSSSASNYASTVATQTDVAKYRGKYKELKAKVREIETENDQIQLKTLNLKRTIQRMRLERALLYERLEASQQMAAAAAAPLQPEAGTSTAVDQQPDGGVAHASTGAAASASPNSRIASAAAATTSAEPAASVPVTKTERDAGEMEVDQPPAPPQTPSGGTGHTSGNGSGMKVTLRRGGPSAAAASPANGAGKAADSS